jgi:hypothetical protein
MLSFLQSVSTIMLLGTPLLAQGMEKSFAIAGIEGIARDHRRVWITMTAEDPMLAGSALHSAMQEALTASLKLRLAQHGFQVREEASAQFRLVQSSFDSFMGNMASNLTRIDLGGVELVACQLGDNVFCPMPGEVYSHKVLKGDVVLLYVDRGEDELAAWLDLEASAQTEIRAKLHQKLEDLSKVSADAQGGDAQEGEASPSTGEAALHLVYVALLPQASLRKLTPKALKEDLEEILRDPEGTLFGRGSKIDKNLHRIEEDLETHWKEAFGGRGSSLDIVIHDVEEAGERIAKEVGRGLDSVKSDVKDILHKPAEVVKKPIREVKRFIKKIF